MKNNFLSIVFLLVLGILFSFCKKAKTDPCENKICGDNAICNTGICECVANSYKVGDGCIAKSANTFYFTGKGCYSVTDTFTFEIQPSTSSATGAYFQRVTTGVTNYLSASASGNYYKKTDGDSIRTIGIFKDIVINGKVCTNEVTGKYIGNNRLDLTIRFFELANFDKTIDKCKIMMKK